MQRRLEYILNQDEYESISRIISTEQNLTEKFANKLISNNDIPKEKIIDFLRGLSTELERVKLILEQS